MYKGWEVRQSAGSGVYTWDGYQHMYVPSLINFPKRSVSHITHSFARIVLKKVGGAFHHPTACITCKASIRPHIFAQEQIQCNKQHTIPNLNILKTGHHTDLPAFQEHGQGAALGTSGSEKRLIT